MQKQYVGTKRIHTFHNPLLDESDLYDDDAEKNEFACKDTDALTIIMRSVKPALFLWAVLGMLYFVGSLYFFKSGIATTDNYTEVVRIKGDEYRPVKSSLEKGTDLAINFSYVINGSHYKGVIYRNNDDQNSQKYASSQKVQILYNPLVPADYELTPGQKFWHFLIPTFLLLEWFFIPYLPPRGGESEQARIKRLRKLAQRKFFDLRIKRV